MRISDWSSDVCSSDLGHLPVAAHPRSGGDPLAPARGGGAVKSFRDRNPYTVGLVSVLVIGAITGMAFLVGLLHLLEDTYEMEANFTDAAGLRGGDEVKLAGVKVGRSEEHTSEIPSLMSTSYAVFCLHKTKNKKAAEHRK